MDEMNIGKSDLILRHLRDKFETEVNRLLRGYLDGAFTAQEVITQIQIQMYNLENEVME